MVHLPEIAIRSVQLRVVKPPKKGDRTPLIARISADPLYMGGGDQDLLCGYCQWVLAHGVNRHRIPSAVIKCPRCDRHNHTQEQSWAE